MKKLSLIIMSVCIFLFSLGSVSAENISYKRLQNIYYNLTVDGKTKSNYVTAFILGNRLAYCIEPGKDITTQTYDTYKDWSKTNFSKGTRDYIEKLGYYGYEYPGHQTDRYYIATQELIWKAVNSNTNIYWTTSENGSGQIINIEQEKQNILDLVNSHDIKPSFIDEKITGKVGETVEIEDTNKVLNNYEISDSKNHQVEIKDNKLLITFNNEETDSEELILTKKKYDSKTLLVYIKDVSQKLAALRLSSDETETIEIQNYKEKEPEKEIVRVPSTADENIIKKFNIKWTVKNNDKKFN